MDSYLIKKDIIEYPIEYFNLQNKSLNAHSHHKCNSTTNSYRYHPDQFAEKDLIRRSITEDFPRTMIETVLNHSQFFFRDIE